MPMLGAVSSDTSPLNHCPTSQAVLDIAMWLRSHAPVLRAEALLCVWKQLDDTIVFADETMRWLCLRAAAVLLQESQALPETGVPPVRPWRDSKADFKIDYAPTTAGR